MRGFRFIFLLLIPHIVCAQEDYLLLRDDVKMYYRDSGEGKALIFIPGWTMTHRFFEKQDIYFSSEYRVITFDPRGQGRSETSAYKNTYADHAEDLHELLLAKDLSDVILIGWSSGCLTVFEYLRTYNEDRINKVVLIDEPPKWIGNRESEWVYGSFEGYRSSLKGLISMPNEPDGIINWMLQDPVDSITREWMREEILMTSQEVALNLYMDGLISDYQEELVEAAKVIPTLLMIRENWYPEAKSWITQNVPEAKVKYLSSHAMFWERPEEFNIMLSEFLNQ